MRLSTAIWWGKLSKSLINWVTNIKKVKQTMNRNKDAPEYNLSTFEKLLPYKLPPAYVSFLKQLHFYPPLQYACDVHSQTEPAHKLYSFVIQNFFHLKKLDKYNLYYNWLYYQKFMEKHFLPIANDAFGNIMALNLESYQVYFFQFDTQKKKHETGVYWVAGSFEEFLNLLYRKRNFI
jgi:hypothetical protein